MSCADAVKACDVSGMGSFVVAVGATLGEAEQAFKTASMGIPDDTIGAVLARTTGLDVTNGSTDGDDAEWDIDCTWVKRFGAMV